MEALQLPVIANINPRSVYNKVNQLKTFIEHEDVDLVFLSESWERENETLDQLINLDSHTVVSNVYQRPTGIVGG